MRDRRPERPRRGALGIDVDPLRVVGGARELVDPRLLDLPPVRDELPPDEVLDHHRTTEAAQV